MKEKAIYEREKDSTKKYSISMGNQRNANKIPIPNHQIVWRKSRRTGKWVEILVKEYSYKPYNNLSMQTTQMSRTCDMTKYIMNKIGLLGMQRIINNMKKAVYKTTWIIFPLKLKIKKGKTLPISYLALHFPYL